MDRRAFLSIVAGSPIIFGLRELLAQDAPADPKAVPEWYQAALKRMKETRRYGVVIVIPADPKERNRWGKELIARSSDGLDPDSLARLSVVFACLTPDLTLKCIGEAMGKENRILLDPDGARISSDVMGIEVVENRKDFNLSIQKLVLPKGMDSLKDRAAELDRTIKEPIRRATADLSANTGPYPRESEKLLLGEADAIMPWIVLKWYEALLAARDERGVIRRMVYLWQFLVTYWIAQLDKVDDANLPYGIKVESVPHDSCPTCGLHARPMRVRRFLEFFEK